MRHITRPVAAVLAALFFVVFPVHAQQGSNATSLRVFLDCSFMCDTSYIKEALPIVDWLNERTQADVHVLHASQRTGSGGEQITLTFIGQRTYAALTDTLTYATGAGATSDEDREDLLHHLTIGLARYLVRAGLSDKLTIGAVRPMPGMAQQASIEKDPWNYWVFSISANGSLDGQETTRFARRRASFSANRTTEALKMSFSGNINESTSEFDVGDETIENSTQSERLSAMVVRSIGERWAIGGTGFMSGSTFSNSKRIYQGGPAVEYNFFPYSQSTRKYLTLQYGVQMSRRYYEELTIFALDEETVLTHSLDLSLSLNQPWGSASFSADATHLLTNFDRSLTDSYRLGLFAYGNVRLFRGLSFNTFASYNRIRDQIDLPGEAATREEILLRSTQLPTGYSFQVNFGFTYRFGSLFNNVVNPRMGGGGGGMVIMM